MIYITCDFCFYVFLFLLWKKGWCKKIVNCDRRKMAQFGTTCWNVRVLPFSIWTDDGMQSFKDFPSECRRQALELVFYSERQTDKPAFHTKTCAVPFFMLGRMALNRARESERERIISNHTWHHTYGVIKSEATQYEFQIGFSRSLPVLMYLILFSD